MNKYVETARTLLQTEWKKMMAKNPVSKNNWNHFKISHMDWNDNKKTHKPKPSNNNNKIILPFSFKPFLIGLIQHTSLWSFPH